MKGQVKETKVLVVEGKRDKQFFECFIGHLDLDIQNINVRHCGGKSGFRDTLGAIIREPNFSQATVKFLGVVRDANTDPDAAFKSVRNALKDFGLPVPQGPMVLTGDNTRVMVLIVPSGNKEGELEDLCLDAVEQDDALPCVEQYFLCLEQQGLEMPRKLSKAKVQVFLASKNSRPDLAEHVGMGAARRYWPFDAAAFELVRNFLQVTFSQRCY